MLHLSSPRRLLKQRDFEGSNKKKILYLTRGTASGDRT